MTAPDYATVTGYELSIHAAKLMWGDPLAAWRDQSPMWEPKKRPFGRYVPKFPNGDIESFRPDTDERHAAEFRRFVRDEAIKRGVGLNYMPQEIYAQEPLEPREFIDGKPQSIKQPLQVPIWHSKIVIGVSKSDRFGVVGKLFECKHASQPRADTITFCKLMDWMRNEQK